MTEEVPKPKSQSVTLSIGPAFKKRLDEAGLAEYGGKTGEFVRALAFAGLDAKQTQLLEKRRLLAEIMEREAQLSAICKPKSSLVSGGEFHA